MASPNLPTGVGGGSASHAAHHNTLHGIVNKLDAAIGTATLGQVLTWNGAVYAPATVSGVTTSGDQTVAGVKTFTDGIDVPDASLTPAQIGGLAQFITDLIGTGSGGGGTPTIIYGGDAADLGAVTA